MFVEKMVPDEFLSLRDQFLKQVNRESKNLSFEREEARLREKLRKMLKEDKLF